MTQTISNNARGVLRESCNTEWAIFDTFEIQMTAEQANKASHPGICGFDVEELLRCSEIAVQLNVIPQEAIREALTEYGAWNDAELQDDFENRIRILWIAAGDINENLS